MDGHFIGHLKNEPEACVAMVNHPKHVELTIFSKRTAGLPMYKWKGNGEVELVPLPFTNGERDGDTVPIKNGAEDEIFDPVNEAEFLNIEENMTADQAASVPTTAKLQLKVHSPGAQKIVPFGKSSQKEKRKILLFFKIVKNGTGKLSQN